MPRSNQQRPARQHRLTHRYDTLHETITNYEIALARDEHVAPRSAVALARRCLDHARELHQIHHEIARMYEDDLKRLRDHNAEIYRRMEDAEIALEERQSP